MELFRYQLAFREFFAGLVNFVCNDLAGKHFALIRLSWDQEDKRRLAKMKKRLHSGNLEKRRSKFVYLNVRVGNNLHLCVAFF